MTTSTELMYAILAMDSYNRDYNVGINVDGTVVGMATILDKDAFITAEEYQEWIDAGFYAIAYDYNGETVISYRGTDSYTELLLTSLPIAGGNDFDEPSVHLAMEFYQAVNGVVNNPPLFSPIVTTGHSLGGALAGFVGNFYGEKIYAVDPIDFYPALLDFKSLLERYIDRKSVV